MKEPGIVRRTDRLGRIVLPTELRKMMGIHENSSLEFFVEDDKIILKRYEQVCVFCGSTSHLRDYRGLKVCRACAGELASSAPQP
ncbi:MAG: AbrB/MazE/SpoVT family DNA-binding domain-containing protein [Firmicutes bacterium]|nr:AbrB/MazE/SpoVT family DNA-binding domain-containing protein [Bacillota bacterium]MDI6824128.1 AbrB/MazE/SpoVT family DNA-binding domain-containing protein [Bacillota bacterium]MDI7249197.1 AbrB/MazE/SpoVT family DNA-binding domain-containing protein [Bacillota bacterium]